MWKDAVAALTGFAASSRGIRDPQCDQMVGQWQAAGDL